MTARDSETIYAPLPVPHMPEKLEQFPPGLVPSAEHLKTFDEVLNHFKAEEYVLPKVENGILREEEKFWLSYECIHRYCRATRWAGSKAAIKRLEETLIWRREYGVYDLITPSHVEPEAVTGKMVLFGYDVDGRPALYLRPSKQNTEETIRQMHFLTYMLECAVDLMGPGVENLALMVDFADRAKNPSIAQSRATINILQNHYPERLGRALIANVPFLVHAFLKMVTPFLDPVTREKMRFNPACTQEGLFTPDMLMREWGGESVFEYKHEQYWPALVRTCEGRREKMMKSWRNLGANVGLKEWDVKRNMDFDSRDTGEVEVSENAETVEKADLEGETVLAY